MKYTSDKWVARLLTGCNIKLSNTLEKNRLWDNAYLIYQCSHLKKCPDHNRIKKVILNQSVTYLYRVLRSKHSAVTSTFRLHFQSNQIIIMYEQGKV